MMEEYRFFRLNGAGLIDAADRARFPDETSAIGFARDFAIGEAVEVWCGGRQLAKLPPQRSAVHHNAAENASIKWRRHSAI